MQKEKLMLSLEVFGNILLLVFFVGYVWKGFEYFEIGCAIEQIRMFFGNKGNIPWPVSAFDKVFIFLWVPALCWAVCLFFFKHIMKPLAVVTAIMMVYFAATRQDPFYIMLSIIMFPTAMCMRF